MENWFNILLMPAFFCLLHLLALILAIVFFKRCPAASALVLGAVLMNGLATVGRVAFNYFLRDGAFPMQFFGILNWAIAIVNFIGYGLLIIAAFVGRTTPTQPRRPTAPPADTDDDDDWEKPVSPPKSSGSTGIEQH
jgi:hypothetical protein